MNDKIIDIAAEVLRISSEEVKNNSKAIPEIEATYFWKPTRDGGAVIIDSKGEKLAVGSAISFKAHLQAFRDGKRN
ncbi:MAG: hypothetical protein K0Q87_480 [Neobacillus sp.]|jgi:hypothetical protein|nr:hypothetical protein [Neobacillus sp.]